MNSRLLLIATLLFFSSTTLITYAATCSSLCMASGHNSASCSATPGWICIPPLIGKYGPGTSAFLPNTAISDDCLQSCVCCDNPVSTTTVPPTTTIPTTTIPPTTIITTTTYVTTTVKTTTTSITTTTISSDCPATACADDVFYWGTESSTYITKVNGKTCAYANVRRCTYFDNDANTITPSWCADSTSCYYKSPGTTVTSTSTTIPPWTADNSTEMQIFIYRPNTTESALCNDAATCCAGLPDEYMSACIADFSGGNVYCSCTIQNVPGTLAKTDYMYACSSPASSVSLCLYQYRSCDTKGNYTGYVKYTSSGAVSPTINLWYCDPTIPTITIYRPPPCENQSLKDEMGSTGGYGDLDGNELIDDSDVSLRNSLLNAIQEQLAYVSVDRHFNQTGYFCIVNDTYYYPIQNSTPQVDYCHARNGTIITYPPSVQKDQSVMISYIQGNTDTFPICNLSKSSCHDGQCGGWFYKNFTIKYTVDRAPDTNISIYSRVKIGNNSYTHWNLERNFSANGTTLFYENITVGPDEICNRDGKDACQINITAITSYGVTDSQVRNFSIMMDYDSEADVCKTLAVSKLSSQVLQFSKMNTSGSKPVLYFWYNNATSGMYKINITSDDYGSGIQSGLTYVIFPNITSPGITDYYKPFENDYAWGISSDFNGTVHIDVHDRAENVAKCSLIVNLDNIAPFTNTTPNYSDAWMKSGRSLTLNCTDNINGSGCNHTYYGIANQTQPCLLSAIASSGISINPPANTADTITVCYQSADNVNNTEAIKNITIKIDKVPPVINIISPCDNCTYGYADAPTLNYSIIDPAGSGLAENASMYYLKREIIDTWDRIYETTYFFKGLTWVFYDYTNRSSSPAAVGIEVYPKIRWPSRGDAWTETGYRKRYELKISVSDIAGNSAFATRHFNVTDVSLPTVNPVASGFHYPQPVDIDYFLTFVANVSHPSYPNANVTKVTVCNSSSCSEDGIYCSMSTNGTSNYAIWSCVKRNLIQYGIGNHTYYIKALDTRNNSRTVGPIKFTVKNITLENISYEISNSLGINVSNITYQVTGDSVGSGVGFCSIGNSSCIAYIFNGSMSGCNITDINFIRGNNSVNCTAYDYDVIIGQKSFGMILNSSLRNFHLTTPTNNPPSVKPGETIGFSVIVTNSGSIDFVNGVSVVIKNSNPDSAATDNYFCSVPISLAAGQEKEVQCNSSKLTSGGIYNFRAYVIHSMSGNDADLSDPTPNLSVSVNNLNLNISVEIVGKADGYIYDCIPSNYCDANYTRGMPADFNVRAWFGNALSSTQCSGLSFLSNYCHGTYSLDGGNFTDMDAWDSDHWIQHIDTTAMDCNSLHNLTFVVEKNSTSAYDFKKFFISCEPRLTSVPKEVTLAIGTKDAKLFNVTLWYPLTTSTTFNIIMNEPNDKIMQWLRWYDHGYIQDLNISLYFSGISNITREVYITNAARSGTHEIDFLATDYRTGMEYSAKSSLGIYSEGLSEFSSYWLLALMMGAAAIFYWQSQNKKTKRKAVKKRK